MGVQGRMLDWHDVVSGSDLVGPKDHSIMFTERFLRDRTICLSADERVRIEAGISEIHTLAPRTTIVRPGRQLQHSTLLVEGIMSRYIDDKGGLRQLVAIHVPGDFVDLHAFPLKYLDHGIGSMTAATVAILPHSNLDRIVEEDPVLMRKLWFATLLDAANHRAWLFRLGRLDAVGRVAHFLSETNARLVSAGLSDGHRFALALTQNDLAEICGLTNVHVNRVIRSLREDGLCIFRSSLVQILDRKRLEARGQFDPAYLYLGQSSSASRH
jgi:CRP-like cAMP-binding protein